MTSRARKHLMKPLALVLAAVSLSGCITPGADSVGRYTAPIGGSPVISNETPYSAALRCMAGYTAHKPIRIAVGQIADYTGKAESDNSGRKLTQGAALMAMSALSKAGVQLVERFDTSVAEMELKYANNKLIGAEGVNANGNYRKIIAGSIPGSDYYLVGGITELNFNIRSEGASGDGGGTATNSLKGTIGGNLYVMNVGLDLRLVDTNTLQVVDVISYQKQIIGHQISAGVFDFLGANFFDASIGESALEPIQLAVRSVVERATLEMMVRLYHTGGTCSAVTDPLADSTDHLTPAVDHPATAVPAPTIAAAAPAPDAAPAVAVATPAPEQPTTNTAPEATITARNEDHPNADASRDHPYHFYNASDPNAPSLRGSE